MERKNGERWGMREIEREKERERKRRGEESERSI